MRFSQRIVGALSLVSLVAAAPLEKRDVVTVKLTEAGNALVEATISNTGASAISLLKRGTILNDNGLERKTIVSKDGTAVPFQGIKAYYHNKDLTDADFVTIAPGASITQKIDLALAHDVTESGTYDIAAVGVIPIAEANSNVLSGTATFSSNKLSIPIDGTKVSKVKKRAVISSSCSSSDRAVIAKALSGTATNAQKAAAAARSGSANQFQTFFRTTDSASRTKVAARYDAVYAQSTSSTSGTIKENCRDSTSFCNSNSGVVAWTDPGANLVVYCDFFYQFPVDGQTCHEADQPHVTLHEFTHCPATGNPGASDYGYWWPDIQSLPASQAVMNADTFALYANAVKLGCNL